MPYLELRYRVPRERAESLSGILQELGALSVTWENAGEDAYLEAAYPQEPDWRRIYVTGLFDSDGEPESIRHDVDTRLGTQLSPQVRMLEDQDWERAWLARFRPRKYAGDLWVCPSWIEPPDPAATRIVMDPGLAFGTGDHATTALCLDWISERDWSGKTVLDYGCGSGILAIACLLKGAKHAFGVDVDPRALTASALNAARNGVSERYEAVLPDGLPAGLRADLVVANILSGVLIEVSADLKRYTGPYGRLLLTGILENDVRQVRSAFEPPFAFDTRWRDQWCLLIGRNRRPRQ